MDYRRTQWGYFAIWTVAILVPVVVVTLVAGDDEPWADVLIVLLVVLITALVFWFSRLTVTVRGGVVAAEFGWGWPRKAVELAKVSDVRKVRNHWYYGFGIRKVPNGWMYNVSGLDAVELQFLTGKVFRIGTNDVEQLLGVLSIQIKR